MNFEELRIKSYKTWTLYLNEYQCYLGRVCLVANRESAKDFISTTSEERNEFFQICEQVNAALKNLFAPDLMNYASLGNNFNHLHVHVIPRYEKERTFGGIKFTDKRWGSNYAPYDREFKIDPKALIAIRDAISLQLGGSGEPEFSV